MTQADLTEEQQALIDRLRSMPAPREQRGLRCGDCGAALHLLVGKFGRFYGCEMFHETGCQGSLSAYDDGRPKGWPGDAATRAARKRLAELFEAHARALRSARIDLEFPFGFKDDQWVDETHFHLTSLLQQRSRVAQLLERALNFSIGELTQEECERAIANWDTSLSEDEPFRFR